jgi:hypothetical protein
MHNEQLCGQRPGAPIKYLRCTTSGAAGNGLGTTLNYLRGTASDKTVRQRGGGGECKKRFVFVNLYSE